MKKFLSLVLALVMTMSLVTISAGAKEFTDDASINYEEAVDVMQTIGVIDGYADGGFGPQNGLSRGAAAKIICNMVLGPTTAAALPTQQAPFKDVAAGSTYAGYVAYCAEQGIINGYADGTFQPGASLSGYAFMKMLLGALGYDPIVEGYTGNPNWKVNVAKQALGIGLAKGLKGDFDGQKHLNREEALLYAFNTLKATMVEYKNAGTITVGNVTISNNAVATQVESTDSGKIYNETSTPGLMDKVQFAEKYFTNLARTTDHDAWGHISNKWSWKGVSVGNYATAADFVFTAAAVGTTVADKIDYLGLEDYAVTTTGDNYYENGKLVSIGADDATALATIADTLVKNGTKVEIYISDTAADTIENIVVTKSQIMSVNAVNSKLVSLSTLKVGDKSVVAADDDNDNFKFLSGLKAKDLVVVTPVATTTAGSSYVVGEAYLPEVASGNLTAVSLNAAGDTVVGVTVDGAAYKMSERWTSKGGCLATTTKPSNTVVSTVYVDQYGYVIYAKDTEATSAYVLMADVYTSLVDGKLVNMVAGYDAKTGEAVTLNFGTLNPLDIDGDTTADHSIGAVYAYKTTTLNSAEYVWDATAQGNVGYIPSTDINVGDVKVDSWYISAGVNFLFTNKNSDGEIIGVTVKEGKQKVTSAYYYVLNAATEVVSVVVVDDTDVSVGTDVLMISKVTGNTVNADNKTVQTFEGYVGTTKVTGTTVKNYGLTAGTFWTFSETDGIYTLKAYAATGKATSTKVGTLNTADIVISDTARTIDTDFVAGLELNALNAVVIDLTTTGKGFASLKDLADAGYTSYTVSVIYDDSATIAKGNVAYIYVLGATV